MCKIGRYRTVFLGKEAFMKKTAPFFDQLIRVAQSEKVVTDKDCIENGWKLDLAGSSCGRVLETVASGWFL